MKTNLYAVVDCPDREFPPTSIHVFHDQAVAWARFRDMVIEDLTNMTASLEELDDAARVAASFDSNYSMENGDNVYECGCSYIAFVSTGVYLHEHDDQDEFAAKLAAARAKTRPPIKVGDKLEFHSTLQGTDSKGILVRQYSGLPVEVLALVEAAEDQDEPEAGENLWMVRTEDGVEFVAWECELNGFIAETDQTIWPEPKPPAR